MSYCETPRLGMGPGVSMPYNPRDRFKMGTGPVLLDPVRQTTIAGLRVGNLGWCQRLPWLVFLWWAGLLGLGWLSMVRYEELAGGSGQYLRQQALWSVVGLLALIGLTCISYRTWCRWVYGLLLLSLGLLAAVYFFPPINGAQRWIRVGPVGLQPSEFAKIAFVLAMARYLMYRDSCRSFLGLLVPLALTMAPVLLILKEPDLGTAAVFLPVLFVMLFAAGARRYDLARLVVAGVLLLPLLWTQMSAEQRSRVTALRDQPGAAERPGPEAFQLHRAKQMLALGGTWGSLLAGQPTEDSSAYRLPEARTDFVFSVLGERLGLPGLALALGFYGVLVWQGLAIAARCREPFGRLTAIGVTAVVGVQVFVNTGMTVGLLPVTGLPLPLMSYGGSGLLAHSIAIGLLGSIGARPGYQVTCEPFRYIPVAA